MKKYLLIMSLLSFVFLGLGNVSLAQTANCHDGGVTCLATEACTLIPADGSFGSTDRYECVLKPTPTPDPSQTTTTQTNTDCLSSCLADPGLAAMEPTLRQDKCTQKCTTTGSVATPCNVVTSSLNGDPNAVVTALGVSCECKPLRGDYYDEVSGKTKCGLCTLKEVCCGTKLSTSIPFIGDCLESSSQDPASKINETTAFPVLITALVKIVISVILVASFILIIVAGVMWSTGDAKGGKDMIVKVAIGLAILGASGVILRLVNPNFFG